MLRVNDFLAKAGESTTTGTSYTKNLIMLDELMKVSEEEQKYLDGQGDIERQLYVKEKIEEIDRELLLKRGQHYVEIMYVAQGSITHCIEGKELVLHKGDVFQAI